MSDRSESPPPPDWSPPASDADAREVRQSLDSFVPPPPPARDALRYSQDSYVPPPPARQSQDSYARQSTDSFAPPPPPPRQTAPPPPPWEDDDDDDDDDAAPRAWHDTDEDAAPRAPDNIGDDFAAADAWAREERVAAEEAKAFAALAADGPPPWADDDPDETTLWQHAKASSKPAWADDEEEGETTALDDLDAAPVRVRRSSEQLERFSRLRKSRSPKKKAPQIDDEGPPPQSALVAKLFGKRPAPPKKPEVIKPVPLSMEDRQALEGELSKTEAELAEARAAPPGAGQPSSSSADTPPGHTLLPSSSDSTRTGISRRTGCLPSSLMSNASPCSCPMARLRDSPRSRLRPFPSPRRSRSSSRRSQGPRSRPSTAWRWARSGCCAPTRRPPSARRPRPCRAGRRCASRPPLTSTSGTVIVQVRSVTV